MVARIKPFGYYACSHSTIHKIYIIYIVESKSLKTQKNKRLGVEKFGKHVPKYYSRGKKKDSGVEKT
jgi:hypothetical protein